MSVPGTVYLVGAGPGDPGLVTARAMELLATADVVIHDRLIPLALLDEVPDGCELINAGKAAGDHALGQDEINALLVHEARKERVVVRLKGGDPYLFGRGGEEGAYCLAHGVPFEVVSGVTSAISVPASAGIPVTHRGVAHHVTIVTASAGPDGQDEPDYTWLAASRGTVVLLMGLRRVRRIANAMIAAGASYERPVAVISQGATSRQRTIVGDLGSIGDLVEGAALESPAIIVVGEVVRLHDALAWFERRPLFGRTIAVTRARAQASTLVAALGDLGADVVECPMIRIEELPSGELDAEIDLLGTRDFLVFTSRNGAQLFFRRLTALGRDARALAGLRVAVVGEATAEECALNGVVADILPPQGARTSRGLLAAMGDEPLFGSSVLLLRGEEGDEALPEGLRERGANLHVVHAYRNVIEVPSAQVILRALRSDLVTFTSASTVRNFARLVVDGVAPPRAVTIGPATTETAIELGFEVVAQAAEPSVSSVVDSVLAVLTSEPTEATPAREAAGVATEPAADAADHMGEVR